MVINQTSDKLSPELRFRIKHITSEDEINFISTDKPILDSMIRDKLSETQINDLFSPEGSDFSQSSIDDFTKCEDALNILLKRIKLIPNSFPYKWKQFSLSIFEQMIEKLKNEDGAINWKNLGTYFCLSESLVPIGPKRVLLTSYIDNLNKESRDSGYLT